MCITCIKHIAGPKPDTWVPTHIHPNSQLHKVIFRALHRSMISQLWDTFTELPPQNHTLGSVTFISILCEYYVNLMSAYQLQGTKTTISCLN